MDYWTNTWIKSNILVYWWDKVQTRSLYRQTDQEEEGTVVSTKREKMDSPRKNYIHNAPALGPTWTWELDKALKGH